MNNIIHIVNNVIKICILYEKEHKTHNKISLGEFIPDIDKLNEDKNNLRKSLDEFKNTINKIINKLI